jgi:2-dehydro-3-deoxygluconokinase
VIADAQSLDLTIGGAEANVGVALVAMGHQARFVSKVPANALGDKARAALAGAGVDVAHFVRGVGDLGGVWAFISLRLAVRCGLGHHL